GTVDVNTIPLSMIERVEVLKDGSSALYGSGAEGGVVNIITKREYSGVELYGRFGQATGKGEYTERGASAVTGATTEDGAFVVSMSWYANDPLLAKNRSVPNESIEFRLSHNLGLPT